MVMANVDLARSGVTDLDLDDVGFVLPVIGDKVGAFLVDAGIGIASDSTVVHQGNVAAVREMTNPFGVDRRGEGRTRGRGDNDAREAYHGAAVWGVLSSWARD